MCLLLKVVLFWQHQLSKINYRKWDMNTHTIDDFTAKMPITKEMWEDFNNKNPDVTWGERPAKFREYLKNYIMLRAQR
jgi:hypothetical protein